MSIIPPVGSVCSYFLKPPFSILNGIYKLIQIMLYETSLEKGIDYLNSLYTPCNLTQAQLDIDWVNYKGRQVLVLNDVNDTSKTYVVPESLLFYMPDPSIIQCHDLYLAIEMGLFRYQEDVSWLLGTLNDIASSVIGVDKTAAMFTNGYKYITQEDYRIITNERKEKISKLNPLTQRLKDQEKVIDTLSTKVRLLEEKIIQLINEKEIAP